mgnify:CR=1 FL=1
MEINQEKKYTQVEGKTYAIGNFSEAIAGLLGGFLATISLILPIQIQASIIFCCIPIAISLVEPHINKEDKIKKGFSKIIFCEKKKFNFDIDLKCGDAKIKALKPYWF